MKRDRNRTTDSVVAAVAVDGPVVAVAAVDAGPVVAAAGVAAGANPAGKGTLPSIRGAGSGLPSTPLPCHQPLQVTRPILQKCPQPVTPAGVPQFP